jgi:hypothetical protein
MYNIYKRVKGDESEEWVFMFMFDFMSAIFPVFFVLILAFISISIIKGIGEWINNNKQPVLIVDACVVSKRSHTSHHIHNHNNGMHHHNQTTYYATFEVESGDRMEFRISGKEYGLLAEKDKGRLTFQGTRYLSFERNGRE